MDPNSILEGQDPDKVARYAEYRRLRRARRLRELGRYAYQTVNQGVQEVIEAVGLDGQGKPAGNIFAVSDHGSKRFMLPSA